MLLSVSRSDREEGMEGVQLGDEDLGPVDITNDEALRLGTPHPKTDELLIRYATKSKFVCLCICVCVCVCMCVCASENTRNRGRKTDKPLSDRGRSVNRGRSSVSKAGKWLQILHRIRC